VYRVHKEVGELIKLKVSTKTFLPEDENKVGATVQKYREELLLSLLQFFAIYIYIYIYSEKLKKLETNCVKNSEV